MDTFGAVSETALITLKARVVELEKKEPVIEDAVAVVLADVQSRGFFEPKISRRPRNAQKLA